MAYSFETIMAILEHAKENGPVAAATMYGVAASTVIRWNKKYNIYETQEMRFFSVAEKIKILEHAQEHGLMATKKEFDVAIATMNNWNKEFNIYVKGIKDRIKKPKTEHKRQSKEFIIEVLNYAKEHGASDAVDKYNVPHSTLNMWNKKYNVYKTRQARVFTDAQKQNIVEYAQTHSPAEAAKVFKVTSYQIKQWADNINKEI